MLSFILSARRSARLPSALAVTLFLSLALSPVGGPSWAAVFNAETFTLSNGMQVVVVPNHRVPVVTHMVWYKVGSADEEPGRTGLAHLLEHLMFKGTEKYGPGEFSARVARLGGRENAFTSYDYTGYYQTVAKDRLEAMMEMEADRMTNLRLTPDLVRPEAQVVLEERRMRTENNPGAILREAVGNTLVHNHPYRQTVIGWPGEIARLDAEDALAFYRKWYAPNNAILVVGGDITAEELRPLAEKYYGSIPARPVPERRRVEEPEHRTERRVILEDQRVAQPSFSRAYLAPSYTKGEVKHAYPLEVLADALGNSATSRLYRELVVEKGLATSAGAWYDPSALDLSQFGVYASPRPGVDLAEVEKAVDSVLATALAEGLSLDEVERAKTRMQAAAKYARDDLDTGARVIGEALTTGQSLEDVESWPERIAAVTVARVNEAARAILRKERSVTGLLKAAPNGPRAAAQPPAPAGSAIR